MKRILVLFNLHDDVDASEYEAWARETDLPTARSLNSVLQFNVYRADGLFGSDAAPPFAYAEWLEVTGLDALGADAQSEIMQPVIEAFGKFAKDPQFIVVDDIE